MADEMSVKQYREYLRHIRQQQEGNIVYSVCNTITGECYLSTSRNSMDKRWAQLKTSPPKGLKEQFEKYGIESFKYEVLEYLPNSSELSWALSYWKRKHDHRINSQGKTAKKESRDPKKYGNGLNYGDQWFPNRKVCWETLGKVPYGTFQARYHQTKHLGYALGLEERPKAIS